MRLITRMVYRGLFLFSFLSTSAQATRTITIPAFARSFNATYPGVPGGTNPIVGFQMYTLLVLTNVTSQPQSGTAGLVAGTSITGGEAGRTGTVNGHIYQCSPAGNNGIDISFPTSAVGYTGAYPSPIAWSLAANQTISINLGTTYTHIFSSTGPSGFDSFVALFIPVIQLFNNGDQGAIVASVIQYADGWNPGMTTCDGSPSPTQFSGVSIPDYDRTFAPSFVLGGQAF